MARWENNKRRSAWALPDGWSLPEARRLDRALTYRCLGIAAAAEAVQSIPGHPGDEEELKTFVGGVARLRRAIALAERGQ